MNRLRDAAIIFLVCFVIGVGLIGIALGEFGPLQAVAIVGCLALAVGVQQVLAAIAHRRKLERQAQRMKERM